MQRLTLNKALSGAIATAVVALAAMPGSASASFTVDNFDTFICPTQLAPASPGTCTGNSAPAGAHRASTVEFDFGGDQPVHDIIQHFPIGIIPNPENVAKCTADTLDDTPPTCPANSQLGTTNLSVDAQLVPGVPIPVTVSGNVYNLQVQPPYAGGLAFVTNAGTLAATALQAPFTIRTGESTIPFLTDTLLDGDLDGLGVGTFQNPPVTPHDSDGGLTGISANIPNNAEGIPIRIKHIDYTLNGINANAGPLAGKPYITLSTGCLTGKAEVEASSYANPTVKVGGTDPNGSNFSAVGTTTGCDATHPPFEPTLPAPVLGTSQSDTPSSYDINVGGLDDGPYPAGEELHESDLRRAEITLPEGTALSPSAANGLVACTDAQLDAGNNNDPTCPAASDIGDVAVQTNNLPPSAQPTGQVYLGQPTPQDTYRLFLAFEIVDGLWVKQKGVAKPDPDTGQITAIFDKLPSLPFTQTTLSMKRPDGTPVLVNPPDCGTHAITSVLTSYKFPPNFPDDSTAKTPSTSFSITGCANPRPFDPSGTLSTNPTQAGADSKLSLGLTNPDRHQLLRTLRVALPPGLVGRLGGIPQCSTGDAATGNCPDASRIGSVSTAIGAGPAPLGLPGSVYLADPLQSGDPASLAVVVPAKVGPFDFGNVVTRARTILRSDGGLDVALVDDLPRIIGGVPVRVRQVDSLVDHDDFIRNATSCAQLQADATFTSFESAEKSSSSPYQATGCDALNFSPKLRLIAEGEFKRFGHPSLRAIVTQPAGEANIASSRVVLPDVIRPDNAPFLLPGGVCSEAAAASRSCPAASQIGTAEAETPLLPTPLSGPVYGVQRAGQVLPGLAVFLDGAVSFRLDASNALQGYALANAFGSVPDLPISKFELDVRGGKNGVLKNFQDLCAQKDPKADATFTAHSGRTSKQQPSVELPTCSSASAAPRASITLRGVRSGSPVLKLRIRRVAGGANLRSLRLTLPHSLLADNRKRSGINVSASRKLGRSNWKLSRRTFTLRKVPGSGAASLTLTLRRGALVPTRTLLSRAQKNGKLAKVTFKLRVGDVANRSFKLRKRVRPRA